MSMQCRVCNSTTNKIFEKMVLHRYCVLYFSCSSCGFLQTQNPDWLKEAYSEPLDKMDTGLLMRNIALSKICAIFIYFFLDPTKKFLDYAGGYGIFVRLMRDIGFDFFWTDPYATNLVARGFEYKQQKPIGLITAIECFEHFLQPTRQVSAMLKISPVIFFTTELMPSDDPAVLQTWSYLGSEHGQHVSFYSEKTLQFLANRFDCKLYTNGKNLHIFTREKLTWFSFRILSLTMKLRGFGFLKRRLKSKALDDSKLLAQQHL